MHGNNESASTMRKIAYINEISKIPFHFVHYSRDYSVFGTSSFIIKNTFAINVY